MGLDTSAHPFDRTLLRNRIIPFILEGSPIDDLIKKSVHNALTGWRANEWGLSALEYDNAISDQQNEITGPERDIWFVAYEKAKQKRGFLARIFAREPSDKDLPPFPRNVLLPGFDSDLLVWGRPFFIAGDTPADVSAMLTRYLEAAAGQPEKVDDIAKDTLANIEGKRMQRPAGAREELWEKIANAPPITHLQRKVEGEPPIAEVLAASAKSMTESWRTIAQAEDLDETVELERYDEPVSYGDLQRALPFEIVNFMAGLTPGWMGRGHGFGSNLIHLVAHSHDDIFETPAEPFAPLAERLPLIGEHFYDTIPGNFSLGGYIPPERIARFIEVLEEYRAEMILAFDKRKPSEVPSEEIDELQADWLKVREAAEYAVQNGMGYLEAAEVYSGVMGMMN